MTPSAPGSCRASLAGDLPAGARDEASGDFGNGRRRPRRTADYRVEPAGAGCGLPGVHRLGPLAQVREVIADRWIERASPATVRVRVAPGAGQTGGLAAGPAAWTAQVTGFPDQALRPGSDQSGAGLWVAALIAWPLDVPRIALLAAAAGALGLLFASASPAGSSRSSSRRPRSPWPCSAASSSWRSPGSRCGGASHPAGRAEDPALMERTRSGAGAAGHASMSPTQRRPSRGLARRWTAIPGTAVPRSRRSAEGPAGPVTYGPARRLAACPA